MSTAVSVSGITKRYGREKITAVDDLSLSVEAGELLVLLGASGCGKTTTLRCVAGLEVPDAGRIDLGEVTVFDASRRVRVPPNRRSIGMVFQSYALWPHMTVSRNIGYPLRARRADPRRRADWVAAAAASAQCSDLLSRYPTELSGGQQQRVALARAIVGRPNVILFDEPLSNLDAKLREEIRSELRELHSDLGYTGIYVTHDQREALALATRVVVMRSGAIEQIGSPLEIFRSPRTEYAASFLGYVNRIGVYRDATGRWLARSTGVEFGRAPEDDKLPAGTAILRTRPEDLRVVPTGSVRDPTTCVVIDAVVADVSYGGRHHDVTVVSGSTRFHSIFDWVSADQLPRYLIKGSNVELEFSLARSRLYDLSGASLDETIFVPKRPGKRS